MKEIGIFEAVKAENLSILNELINSGEDVNQQDEQGWTPLNWAAGKGNLPLVKLLIERGGDVLKVGRDKRTPHLIALAAGHLDVARFLREEENQLAGLQPIYTKRKYCKAYHLADLRSFQGWSESRINWKEKVYGDSAQGNGKQIEFFDGDIVFLHQDYTVTQSMTHNENVIFNHLTPEWKEFCSNDLSFFEPDDLDLIA